MRLTCPNCGAQYEVPDDVIPDAGRDVQCSNCGHSWFVSLHMDATEDDVDDLGQIVPQDIAPPPPESAAKSAPASAPVSAPPPEVVPEPKQTAAAAAWQPDAQYDQDFRDEDDVPFVAPPRPMLEPKFADVLREEAAYEARARSEQQSVEVQPDLGLTAPAPRPSPRARDDDETAHAVSTIAAASRRDLLPDIEEINSTLRASSEPRKNGEVQAADAIDDRLRRRRGFRTGFGLALLIFGGAAILYTYAPLIADKVPQLTPFLDQYVEAGNNLRMWLENQVASLVERISALTGDV